MKVSFYKNYKGKEPLNDWLIGLKDSQTELRIHDRIDRIEEFGILGDFKHVLDEIYELRFHFGAGYRIYFSYLGDREIIFLRGGDKSSQNADISKAKQHLEDFKNAR